MPNDARLGDPPLPETVRDHLGRELRTTYAASAEKPQYLGDPAIPPELSAQVMRLEGRLKAHEQGTEAVKDALEAILDRPLDGLEAQAGSGTG